VGDDESAQSEAEHTSRRRFTDVSISGQAVRRNGETTQGRGSMQQYMLLIHDQDVWETLSDDEQNAIYEEYSAFSRELRDQGRFVSAHELQPKTTAATVRVREGETLVTDGPFAETKEALGGYFLIEADSLDEATTWAARIPTARYGVVEVRQVVIQEAEVGA
jgi:hypothetical protein